MDNVCKFTFAYLERGLALNKQKEVKLIRFWVYGLFNHVWN